MRKSVSSCAFMQTLTNGWLRLFCDLTNDCGFLAGQQAINESERREVTKLQCLASETRIRSLLLESFLIAGWQMIRPVCHRGFLHTLRLQDAV